MTADLPHNVHVQAIADKPDADAPKEGTALSTVAPTVRLWEGDQWGARGSFLRQFTQQPGLLGCRTDVQWLTALGGGLGHKTFLIEAVVGDRTVGLLPLALMRSLVFGRHLVSLPYINSSGVLAEDEKVAGRLIERAVQLADEHRVRHLQLRHEREFAHPALTERLTSKVHMRLALPATTEELWKQLKPKVRNQIRKAEKVAPTVHWGRHELLHEFYEVFSRNMRDLGTPVFGWKLFDHILTHFPGHAEICSVRRAGQAVASALLVHGPHITEVPSASSLRSHNSSNVNMLMYWHLLQRAVERGQGTFDFGRSTEGSNTFRFKKQWGAKPEPAVWQYYVRRGRIDELRPETGRFRLFVRLWRRMPVVASRLIGPRLVRGIP